MRHAPYFSSFKTVGLTFVALTAQKDVAIHVVDQIAEGVVLFCPFQPDPAAVVHTQVCSPDTQLDRELPYRRSQAHFTPARFQTR